MFLAESKCWCLLTGQMELAQVSSRFVLDETFELRRSTKMTSDNLLCVISNSYL